MVIAAKASGAFTGTKYSGKFFHVLFHLVPTATQLDRCYNPLPFTEEALKDLLKVPWLGRGIAGI